MAFDTTALTAYVDANSKKISSAAIGNAQTAQLLIDAGSAQFGAKGKTAILRMDVENSFQDGSTCGRTAVGDVTLDDAFVDVKPIKDLQNLCTKSLWNTYYSWALRKGSNPETEGWDADFADYLMDVRAKKIAEGVEKLIWQGDTASADVNLNKIDGLLKQAGTATAATGSDIVAKLQSIFMATNVNVRSAKDFRIFVGEDVFAAYTMAMASKNIYVPNEANKLFGTSAIIEPVAGLNGTNKVVATRLSNIVLGMDGEGDMDKAVLRYSVETENWYLDFHFAVGVAFVSLAEIKFYSV